MALDKIKIGCSPLSGKIYVGYVMGQNWSQKVDRTDEAINAVIDHWMLDAGERGVVIDGTGPKGKLRITIEYLGDA